MTGDGAQSSYNTNSDSVCLYPSPGEPIPPADIYADLTLPDSGPEGRPYVAINMVSTVDGRVTIDGKASGIGSGVDRALMRNIRSAFDAVLVGAGTLRKEELNLWVSEELAERRAEKGLARQPLGVVLAGNGRIPAERRLFGKGRAGPLVVIAAPESPLEALCETSARDIELVRTTRGGRPEPREAVEILQDRFGVSRLLIEGGPSVNHSFLSGLLVDELFLTLAPKLVGGEDPGILEGRELSPDTLRRPELQLLSACLYRNEIFLRYAIDLSPH